MMKLKSEEFAEFFKSQTETGMDYFVVTVFLKDGRNFPQTVVSGGCITQIRGQTEIPFMESDIDHFVVTHDKWKW